MISLLQTAAFPEYNNRERVCILIPGFFERLNDSGEYEVVNLEKDWYGGVS